jgi:hypothetical protein
LSDKNAELKRSAFGGGGWDPVPLRENLASKPKGRFMVACLHDPDWIALLWDACVREEASGRGIKVPDSIRPHRLIFGPFSISTRTAGTRR